MVAVVTAPASAATCPPPGISREAGVTLTTAIAAPTYHNDLTRARITRQAGHPAGTTAENSGLTRSRTAFSIRPRVTGYGVAGGPATCLVLDKVEARWQVTELRVDVASEYRPGTCQHREVLEHENQHVDITRDTFREFVPRMEARLKRAAAEIAPARRGDAQQVADRALERLRQAAGEVIAEFQATMRRRHAAIDTPENYRAVSARCDGW